MARKRSNHDLTEVDVTLVTQTKLAYLFDNGRDQIWIPKSMCEFTPNFLPSSKSGTVELSEALAIEKGLV